MNGKQNIHTHDSTPLVNTTSTDNRSVQISVKGGV